MSFLIPPFHWQAICIEFQFPSATAPQVAHEQRHRNLPLLASYVGMTAYDNPPFTSPHTNS
jgi:hypothetical protein